ncbi:hypothetical protein DSM106972_013430 [Dulcicalothrix desertica PCC 7102]|uniref:PIN domain-containing protein n=1 Tax=Dulcicalothrix desertica PCC 7102 TaxID=232991 RepID=A0A3S1APS8_9CYAN|nr:twitching motility protein PilT [Dulcicalothrix desertica]RUT08175.1 hypothetical protein DSM106972_013430 [Dulcicalothrix desertica PCC 7102]TWH40047.1 hypothetical protein CAL7102_09336 [Dulcicalothrix desertica PCC 7102]
MGDKAKAILSAPDSQLVIPATVLAEAVWIVERGRTSISEAITIVESINLDTRAVVYPSDTNVIQKTINLVAIGEMHDRQIVATAMVLEQQGEKVALLSCDQNITASGLVTIIW